MKREKCGSDVNFKHSRELPLRGEVLRPVRLSSRAYRLVYHFYGRTDESPGLRMACISFLLIRYTQNPHIFYLMACMLPSSVSLSDPGAC